MWPQGCGPETLFTVAILCEVFLKSETRKTLLSPSTADRNGGGDRFISNWLKSVQLSIFEGFFGKRQPYHRLKYVSADAKRRNQRQKLLLASFLKAGISSRRLN